jgi:hypothetical protein
VNSESRACDVLIGVCDSSVLVTAAFASKDTYTILYLNIDAVIPGEKRIITRPAK